MFISFIWCKIIVILVDVHSNFVLKGVWDRCVCVEWDSFILTSILHNSE